MDTRAHRAELLAVDAISTLPGRRPLTEASVLALMESIKHLGLRTPISVRMADPDGFSDPVLVAGYHRLEAAKRLGWTEIECFVTENESEDQARMWEIAENLHRADLSALERSEQIAEWVDLMKKGAQFAPPLGGKQPHVKGIKAAVRELGIERREAQRAVKVASITPEAKNYAREVGLDNNQSVLEAAAKSPDNIAFLRSEHARREAERARKELERAAKDQDRVVQITEAERFANWLMERTDLAEMPTIISWLEGTKPKEVIAALRRIAA